MNREEFFLFGTVLKPHGIRGGFIVSTEVELVDEFLETESVFIEIDKHLIPFFVSEDGVQITGSHSMILHLDTLFSDTDAKEFTGCDIYLEKKMMQGPKAEVEQSIEGFLLFDGDKEVGTIISIEVLPKNSLLIVEVGGEEKLIPLSEDLIVSIDPLKRVLVMDLPEGILDI